jgi:hypothetical protein
MNRLALSRKGLDVVKQQADPSLLACLDAVEGALPLTSLRVPTADSLTGCLIL